MNRARFALSNSVAVVALVAVSLADVMSGPDASFTLLYLLVVAFVAWASRTAEIALASAAVCTAVSLWIHDATVVGDSVGVVLWNVGSRLMIFSLIGLLIVRLSRSLEVEKALARTDFLTGTLNLRAFDEFASDVIARAKLREESLAVALIDLDDFKAVNDRLGHEQGDTVLREVARVLRSGIRSTDAVARIGGDEFAVFLPQARAREAQVVIEKLQTRLADHMRRSGWGVTFSIGVAVSEAPPTNLRALIQSADALMYQAKLDGKNCVRVAPCCTDQAKASLNVP
jgi:diguanylate cyclase (GGDEF)-like protein